MKDTADPQISGHINALIKKYAEAVHNSDAAALATLCTEEAVFVTPGGVVYGPGHREMAYRRVPATSQGF
jgi:ketosteroid isomerase-like protein